MLRCTDAETMNHIPHSKTCTFSSIPHTEVGHTILNTTFSLRDTEVGHTILNTTFSLRDAKLRNAAPCHNPCHKPPTSYCNTITHIRIHTSTQYLITLHTHTSAGLSSGERSNARREVVRLSSQDGMVGTAGGSAAVMSHDAVRCDAMRCGAVRCGAER